MSSLVAFGLRSEPNKAKLDKLAEAEWDEHDPLLVIEEDDGSPRVVDGIRRLKLAQHKGIKQVEVINLGRITEAEALTLILRSGITHRDRPGHETARLIERLMRENPELKTQGAVGTHLGISRKTVNQYMKFLKASKKEKASVKAGRRSMTSVVRKKVAKAPAGGPPAAGDKPMPESVQAPTAVQSLLAQTPSAAVRELAHPDFDIFAGMGEVAEAKVFLDQVLKSASRADANGKREILAKVREVATTIEATLGAAEVAHV